jgi:F-type H+-transporting ATPase subunit delta
VASFTTIARPYARALFEYAQAHKAVPKWSERLVLLSAAAQHPQMRVLLNQPQRSRAERAELLVGLLDAADKKQGAAAHNFLRILADNNRLLALPEIAEQFEQLRAEQESTVEATLITAQEVPKAQLAAITKALEKRFGKKVQLQDQTDASLIGGAVIKVGDLVIDGSVKSRLDKLAASLLR